MAVLASALLLSPAIAAGEEGCAAVPVMQGALPQAQYCLNVVYFVGQGVEPVSGYRERLGALLRWVQAFYAREMAYNGFGPRTFGLAEEAGGMVEIQLLRGRKAHNAYGCGSDAAETVWAEVQAYLAAHPEKCRSAHTLVVMPTLTEGAFSHARPGGVPFCGYGRGCFVLDYAQFDLRHLGERSDEGRALTKWLGGLAHELGHAMNLPHNDAPAGDFDRRGTPLMGTGNYTLGTTPTYLTKASCNLLACCQLLAPAGDATVYYPEHAAAPELADVRLRVQGDTLHVGLRCRGAAYVNLYVQDPPYGCNDDYDAVSYDAPLAEDRDGYRRAEVQVDLADITTLPHVEERCGESALDIVCVARNGLHYRTRITIPWQQLPPDGVIAPGPLQLQEGY